jgi:hypothetical protein
MPDFTKQELFEAVANSSLGWQDMVMEAFAAKGFLCPRDIELLRILKPGGGGGGGGGTVWDFVPGPLSGPSDPDGTPPALYQDPLTGFLYFKITGNWVEVGAARDWPGPTN